MNQFKTPLNFTDGYHIWLIFKLTMSVCVFCNLHGASNTNPFFPFTADKVFSAEIASFT